MILTDQTRTKLIGDLKAGIFNMSNYPELSGDNSTVDVSMLAPDEIEFLIDFISRINSHPDYAEFANVKIDRELKIKILNTLLTGLVTPESFQEYAKPNRRVPDFGYSVDDTVILFNIYRKIEKKSS